VADILVCDRILKHCEMAFRLGFGWFETVTSYPQNNKVHSPGRGSILFSLRLLNWS